MTTKHAAALELAQLGYRVFPCKVGEKKPACKNGLLDATTDEWQIDAWWLENTNYNIGLATDGLLVVDIDGADNPLLSDAEKMLDLAAAPIAQTPRGGRHYFFKQPEGAFKNTQSTLAAKVDTRAAGGYVVAAPSTNGDGNYSWLGEPLTDFPHSLPLPPRWVVDGLAKKPDAKPAAANTNGEIPNGQRNASLASLAGSMRRDGANEAAILAALLAANVNRCKPPLPEDEVRKIAASVSRYEPKENPFRRRAIEKFTLTEMIDGYPELNPPVVDGLFRAGETVNIISTSKIGKSWLAYGLAISIIMGRDWLDSFECSRGKVLLIDNELHRPTIANRIPKVGAAMDCFPAEYADQLEVWPLRGNLRSLEELRAEFDKIEAGEFKVIILDAKYRFQKPGTSENDNAEETQIYNLIDNYADKLGACFVLIHHGSKGDQSEKRVTDVGSGAGAQSRAADCHLVLREHEEKNVVVLDAAVRSFAPVESLALRWQFPLWVPDEYADTTKLKGNKSRQEQQRADRDKEAIDKIIAALMDGRATCKELIGQTGISRDRLQRLLGQLVSDDQILTNKTTRRGNSCDEYGLPKSDL